MLLKYTILAFSAALLQGGLASPVRRCLGVCDTKPHDVVDCIHKQHVEIITNTSEDFSAAVHPFNTRVPWEPLAVTIPKCTEEVSIAVKCAKQFGIKVAARSGGHSYGGYNLGGQNGSLVIDLLNFHDISLDPVTHIATVGPAVRLGNLATHLFKNGKRGLAFGTCPGVGAGGHALHGGFGPHTRLWGALLDNIVDIEVVLADGTITNANEYYNKDLFWALRGAGSSYGIVTKFYFKTYSAPENVINFDLEFPDLVPSTAQGKVDVILALQEYGLHARKEIGLQIFYLNGIFKVSGMYYGGIADYQKAIEPLKELLPHGSNITTTTLGYLETLEKAGMVKSLEVPVVGYNASEAFFSTSLTITKNDLMTSKMLSQFFENLEDKAPRSPSMPVAPVTWLVLAELHGGGDSILNAMPESSSSLAHRDTLFTWQFLGITYDAKPPFPAAGIDFIHGIFSSMANGMAPQDVKGYVNMFDSTLSPAEAHRRYYGNASWDGKSGSKGLYDRLVDLKHRFDPDFVFWNPQAIGV